MGNRKDSRSGPVAHIRGTCSEKVLIIGRSERVLKTARGRWPFESARGGATAFMLYVLR